jgi:hypothetical protein
MTQREITGSVLVAPWSEIADPSTACRDGSPSLLMTTDRIVRRVPWYPTSREKRARCPEFPARCTREDRVCAFL